MYKPSTYLVVTYFLTYLYIWDLFLTELISKVKPNINSLQVNPQLSNKGHPVDGARCTDGCWFTGNEQPPCHVLLVWTPCIMHRCVISTMFGWCFWFFKKKFLFKQPLVAPPPPWSFAFPTPVLYLVDPPPPGPSHFPLRFFNPSIPPRPVLHISHSDSLPRRSPPPGPTHFSLQFFTPLIPPPARSFEFPTSVL
jgi:hypothetical protein